MVVVLLKQQGMPYQLQIYEHRLKEGVAQEFGLRKGAKGPSFTPIRAVAQTKNGKSK